MTKAFVILNPVAGSSQPEGLRETLKRRFAEAGQVCELHETTGEERIVDVVRQALNRGFDLVIAAGGDGTVSGAADGLAHAGVPLGIIPVGTGNALARDLGIPVHVDEALDLLLTEHTVRRIDALQVGDRFFVLNVGVGASAKILRDTESDSKRRFGRLAYLWNVMDKLFGLKRHRFSLTLDGEEKRLRATEVLVLNSGAIGSPYLHWGAHVQADDGQVRVYVLRPRAVLDYFSIAWNLLLGQRHEDPNVRTFDAEQRIVIRADRRLAVQGDGEVIGHTPVEVRVAPSAVQVIMPRTEKTTDSSLEAQEE